MDIKLIESLQNEVKRILDNNTLNHGMKCEMIHGLFEGCKESLKNLGESSSRLSAVSGCFQPQKKNLFMQYAIETLRIEEHKLREAIRAEERYSVYPEYIYSQIEFKERLIEILKAIEIIERSAENGR